MNTPKLIGIIVAGTNLSASTQKMNGAQLLSKKIKENASIPIFMGIVNMGFLPWLLVALAVINTCAGNVLVKYSRKDAAPGFFSLLVNPWFITGLFYFMPSTWFCLLRRLVVCLFPGRILF